eukprot:g28844.t1
MSQAVGLIYAFVAAIAFGIQYVPVKKYEIFEGTAFQWFMCNGILMCGFIIAAASGELQRGLSPLVMLGGVFWASSNYLVLPLVKLLGIGLGFSLYHFVNLMTGYCIGRFGLFGVKVLTGKLLYCDIGCFLILISFFAMVFVEAGHENGEVSDSDIVKATGTMAKAEELGTLDRLGPGAQKVLGVVLAILAGVLCGVNGVPATLWEAWASMDGPASPQHPEADAFSVALPQCLGIWVCSSGILIVYSSLAVVKLKKSVIGPAYGSGCIWGIGFACMMKGIANLGYSVGYTLDAVGPILVSSLLSVFVFKEITNRKPLMIYFGAFTLQLVGVLLIGTYGEP